MADSFSGLFGPDVPYQAANLDFTTTGVKARFAMPYKAYLRRVAVGLNAVPGDAGIVLVKKYVTPGVATGAVTLATLNMLTTHAIGQVVYFDFTTTVTVSEGDELIFEVTDASAAVNAADCWAIVRQSPEVAANNSEMVLTT